MQKGDVVVRIADAPVYEISDLWLLESALPPGDVGIEYFRGADALSGEGRVA